MHWPQRTHGCGELRADHAGTEVVLNAWVHRIRDLGGLFFVDLRDRTGIVQALFDPAVVKGLESLKNESCVAVSGKVSMRDDSAQNKDMATGQIEVLAASLQVLGPSAPLPFPVSDEAQMKKVNEELRVKHRYLDLRRPSMLRRLQIRAAATSKIRRWLDDRGFLEIETPIFTRSTPEGARDYLVPYRLEPGKFYALPQSPQQYKQLLMAAGVERYYQIAKCFRDESQRADRQPEFTQLDLEMSFVTQEDILQLMEGLVRGVVNELIDEFSIEREPIEPFARLTYDDALRLYGSDKPDLRFGLPIFDFTEAVALSSFGVFQSAVEAGGVVRGVRYPGGGGLSRKEIGELEEAAKSGGARGLATIALESEHQHSENAVNLGRHWLRSSIAKFLTAEEADAIVTAAEAEPGDLICIAAAAEPVVSASLGRVRLEIGRRAGLMDPRKLACAYVVDFPLVEWSEEEQRWDPSHHPFTMPKVEDLEFLESDPGRVRADCYDLVCNGVEWASGSIRIHRPDIQARIFSLIGIDEETQRERFGHMLDAFRFGAPPHGGMAPGLDRMVMFLTGDENIREVIAFPKLGGGLDPMMGAPAAVDEAQLKELGLALRPNRAPI
jgi:aspartyl-tRNA synthetase